jgi:hypothetical protein
LWRKARELKVQEEDRDRELVERRRRRGRNERRRETGVQSMGHDCVLMV